MNSIIYLLVLVLISIPIFYYLSFYNFVFTRLSFEIIHVIYLLDIYIWMVLIISMPSHRREREDLT